MASNHCFSPFFFMKKVIAVSPVREIRVPFGQVVRKAEEGDFEAEFVNYGVFEHVKKLEMRKQMRLWASFLVSVKICLQVLGKCRVNVVAVRSLSKLSTDCLSLADLNNMLTCICPYSSCSFPIHTVWTSRNSSSDSKTSS